MDIHFHGDNLHFVMTDPELLQQLTADIKLLHKKVDRIIMLSEDTKAIVLEIDTETNAVAARVEAQLKALKDQIASGNGDTAALQQIHDGLAPIAARLRAIAADPSNPVPVDPNPPVPTV